MNHSYIVHDLLNTVSEAEGLIVTRLVIKLYWTMPHGKWIGRLGSGMELMNVRMAAKAYVA